MIEGLDCASSTVGHIPALKAAGVKFVCRYLAPDEAKYDWKRLSAVEAAALKAAGLGVVVVFESVADRALAGYTAGVSDATIAARDVIALGLPGIPVYFAVDFDAHLTQQHTINSYLAGAVSVLGAKRVGVYGSYYVAKRSLDAGACRYAWQTYAWSGGLWEPRAQLRQYQNGVTVAGLSVDRDRAMVADYGQWKKPVTFLLVYQGGKVVKKVRYGGGRVKAYVSSKGFFARLKAGAVKLVRRSGG